MRSPGCFQKLGFQSLLLGSALAVTLSLSGCMEMIPADVLKMIPPDILKMVGMEATAPGEDGHAETEGAEEEVAEVAEPFSYDESSLVPPAMRDFPYEEIESVTTDGTILYARLYDPYQAAEADLDPTVQYPLVVLAHGIDRSHRTWGDLPARLVKAGYAVLAVDLRGHGRSIRNRRGQPVSWRLLEQDDWQNLPKDVLDQVQTVSNVEDYPQIDTSRLALIGEGVGANVLAYVGHRKPSSVEAMVMLSPGMEYKSLMISRAIENYMNAAYLIAGSQDEYSYQSTQRIYKWIEGPKLLQLYKNIGTGAEMLKFDPEIKDKIVVWLGKYMPAEAKAIPEEEEAAPEAAAAAPSEESGVH